MNNNTFTMNEKNEALTFANAMGLASAHDSSEEISTALGFAQAMGLRVKPVLKKKASVVSRNILVPQFRFC